EGVIRVGGGGGEEAAHVRAVPGGSLAPGCTGRRHRIGHVARHESQLDLEYACAGGASAGGTMNKKYIVTLTAEERAALQAMIAAGKRAARTLAHARILLKADVREGVPVWVDAAIS